MKLNSVEAGVDWVTATVKDRSCAGRIASLWEEIVSRETKAGGVVVGKSKLGYDGMGVNGNFWGVRDDSMMLMLSGKTAHQNFLDVYRCNVNITRIDIQVTVSLPEYDGAWGEKAVIEAQTLRASLPNRNWARIRHLRSFGFGDTVSVGSRSSDKYGRIYDKEKQQRNGSYERCWRYEIEYKGDYAKLIAAELYSPYRQHLSVAHLVRSQFEDWGFSLPIDVEVVELPQTPTSVNTDQDRTLDWLSKQVSPSIAKLIDGGVSRETLLSLLGLCGNI